MEGRCKGLLRLDEREAKRLAEALEELHLPRSLIILEAVQAGLAKLDPACVPGKRTHQLHFRLPADVREKVRRAAAEHHLSQQALIRHMLFTYLSSPQGNHQTNRAPDEAKPEGR